MHASAILLPFLVSCASVARAVAPPAPLVPYEVKTDEDVARALREHYTKHEYRIPMRDGVRLHTHVYTPKDASRPWPILMARTPYGVGPYGVENYPPKTHTRSPAPKLAIRAGYILVQQDVRGRLMSEGDFADIRPRADAARRARGDKTAVDEVTDAYDTVDWLVKNVSNHNGRVGLWGISYPGFYAAQAAVDAHPAVKAVSPQAPVTEWFLGDDFHHNGALCLADAFAFYATFGRARPKPVKKTNWEFDYDTGDVYDFFLKLGPVENADARHFEGKIAFWNELMQHPSRDAWWQARDPRPHYKNIRPAVLVVGGWFDAEDLWGTLQTYRAMNSQSPGGRVSLVMGPWAHGGWMRSEGESVGAVSFGAPTSVRYREEVELKFFEHHLRGAPAPVLPEAWVFETGSNEWRSYDAWPPGKVKSTAVYLGANSALAASPGAAGEDRYLSDPRRPVPSQGTATQRLDHDYMTEDQRFATRRPDVLTWSTGVVADEFALAGPIEADLWITTTGSDADFVVKLVDVWPEDTADPDPNPRRVRMGGYQQLVRAEVMRARFRNGFDKAEALSPGRPTRIAFSLPDVNHTFRAGHRLMVQVQSTWFPMIDRNPQTFVADISRAKESDFVAATHAILRGGAHASAVRLPLLRGRLP
jgi:hypothetical protein